MVVGYCSSKLKAVSSWCLAASGGELLLGTEGGNVHFFNLTDFCLSDQRVLYQDTLILK